MFFKKPSNPLPNIDHLLPPQPVVNIAPTPSLIISQEIEYRPCYVNGRRALFHRWVNTANPVLPKGVSPDDERAKFFQHRSTTGLVEYADGTVERVWPQEIRFADSAGRFREYAWDPDGQEEKEK
jgi:hypothetical protein